MPYNGSNGTFTRLYNWQQDRDANIRIRADRMDAEDDGFATGLSTAICKDGQTTPTANLPMGGFRHTNVSDGASRTQYASVGQLQDGVTTWVDAGGTADAITAAYDPALTALVDGMLLGVRAAAANATETPTFSPNALTAHTIVKRAGLALCPGDIAGAGHDLLLRYDEANTRWMLLNPSIGRIGPVDEKTGAYSVTGADASKMIAVDATSAPITVSLLAAATAGDGFVVTVKKVDSSTNAVTVDPNSSETIDGAATVSLTEQWQGVTVRSDGTNWQRESISLKPVASKLIGADSSGNIDSISLGSGLTLASSTITRDLPRSYIAGLVLSNNGTDANKDIDISAGEARDATNAVDMYLAAALTKQIDATWAVGTNQGGLDTGSVTTSTWYYVWLIKRSDTGVVDALFSTSNSSPTMPSNYDYKRLIGGVLTDSSSNIIAFSARELAGGGTETYWSVKVMDVDNSTPGTSANLGTLRVPRGQKHTAILAFTYIRPDGSQGRVIISSPDETDAAPVDNGVPLATLNAVNGAEDYMGLGGIRVRTNTSGQVRYRVGADAQFYMSCWGWIDERRA